MGPRSIDRGNTGWNGLAAGATLLQWGRDQLIAEMKAAKIEAWCQKQLQWGRDQLIAEITVKAADGPKQFKLQWGRDQLIAEIALLALIYN